MSDAVTEYWCYFLLYGAIGGSFAGWIAMYRLLQPKYLGLVLFCLVFCVIAFGVRVSTDAALHEFSELAGLTAMQEAIRARLLRHTSFVGLVVPALAFALAAKNLNDFANARSSRVKAQR